MISSLHEIAKLIGPEWAESNLFPVFDKVFKENSKYHSILNSSIEVWGNQESKWVSISVSSWKERESDWYIPESLSKLEYIFQKDHPNQWRVRELIAE